MKKKINEWIAYIVQSFSESYHMIKTVIQDVYWVYGTCCGRPARKHVIDGNVQFVLWKAGEQGFKEDHWVNFDSSWWGLFKEYE
jgi:hypothetical protein